MRVSEAVLAGEKRAERESVTGWGVMGFFFAIGAIPAAHLRTPSASAEILSEHDDDETVVHFSSGYCRALKDRQIKAAWTGFFCALGLWVVLVSIAG